MNKMLKVISTVILISFFITGCESDVKSHSMTVTGMGTVISCNIYGTEAEAAWNGIFDEFNRIEEASSLTDEASEINLLSEVGYSNNKYLVEQAEIAQDIYISSGGIFDYTVGGLTTLWNIGFENAKKPTDEQIKNALLTVDASKCRVEGGVFYIGKGQRIDFGGIAKGYALDKAREVLDNSNVSGAVISVGGSVLFYGENPKNGYWVCAVRDPFDTENYLGTFKIKSGCVSTSGSYERFFEEDGTVYHHILDTQTGYPAVSDLVSVTVVCDNGAVSDALSTACFSLGTDKGRGLMERYGAAGIFVDKNGKITVVGDIEFEEM